MEWVNSLQEINKENKKFPNLPFLNKESGKNSMVFKEKTDSQKNYLNLEDNALYFILYFNISYFLPKIKKITTHA